MTDKPRLFVLALVSMLAAGAAAPPPAAAQAKDRIVPDSRQEITLSYAPVVKKVIPSVVNIYASRVVQGRQISPFFNDPFFRRFFGDVGPQRERDRVQKSLGSGVIVDGNGLIVTNHHVIDGADEVKVALSDRREFDAKVVLDDEKTDLAVLKIEAGEALPALQFDDSDDLEVGDLVLAIGNPFGVGQTVTNGIISATSRTQVGVSDYGFFLQTDAAINPGNSGGALVDMHGRLVGINSAIYSRSGGSLGIGFAIPSNMVRLVVQSAKSGNAIERPWFGASLQAVTADIAESLGLDRPRGCIVGNVYPGSPAARAGLRTGDVVVAVDGREVSDPSAFGYRFATRGIGGTTKITYLRSGAEKTAQVDLVAGAGGPAARRARPLRQLALRRRQGRQPVAPARRGAGHGRHQPRRRRARRAARLDRPAGRPADGRHRARGQRHEDRLDPHAGEAGPPGRSRAGSSRSSATAA